MRLKRCRSILNMISRSALSVKVMCYAGSRGSEAPRAFQIGKKTFEVLEILREWIEEDQAGPETRQRVYDVLCQSGELYRLTHRLKSGTWSAEADPNLLKGI